jgi:hypothetical protein
MRSDVSRPSGDKNEQPRGDLAFTVSGQLHFSPWSPSLSG